MGVRATLATAGLVRTDNTIHVTRRQLLRFESFRRFAMAQGLCQVFDAALTVVFANHLLFMRGSGPTITTLLQMVATALVPLLTAGPIAGVLADRFTRRHILVGGQMVRSAVALGTFVMISTGHVTGLVILWGVALCTNRVTYTARAVSIRHIVRHHELVAADSFLVTVSGLSGIVGGGAGLLGVRTLGAPVAMVILGFHVLSALMYARVTANLGGGRDHDTADWAEARRMLGDAKMRFTIAATGLHRFVFGSAFAVVILTLDDRADHSAPAYAAALSACGAGSLTGSVTAEWCNEHLPRKSLSVLAFAGSALVLCVALLVDRPFAYLAALVLTGFAFQNLRVCSDATIQTNAARGAGGRTFAVYDLTHNFAHLVGIMAGLCLAAVTRASSVLVLDTVTFALGATVFSMARRESTVDSERLAMVKAVHPSSRKFDTQSVVVRSNPTTR